ncbi:hypothetical protein V6N12_067335 [Hibiscus sabdariffa]|uniref:Uncharacterized protein n=1 Tax=Hibiscus sabdariffa TaxID=183260 RepID=A0ABR2BE23_9ROSI
MSETPGNLTTAAALLWVIPLDESIPFAMVGEIADASPAGEILPNTTPDLFGALVGCGYWRPGISEQNRCFKFYKSQTFWFKQSQRKLSMKDSVKERSSPLVYGPVGA